MGLLREFLGDMSRSLSSVVEALSQSLGPLDRVGGPSRIYTIDEGKQGAIFALQNGAGIGLGWTEANANIETIYFWNQLDLNAAPDYAIDLPASAVTEDDEPVGGTDFETLVPTIVALLKTQKIGRIAL